MNAFIAAFTGYTERDKVSDFVESAKAVSNPEDEILILYNGYRSDIHDYLDEQGVEYVQMPAKSFNPFLSRFCWFAEIIESRGYHKVLLADIRDVVFQSNPFEMMKDYNLILCDEGFPHEQDEWNSWQMQAAYPEYWEKIKTKNVMNVGVIGGKGKSVAKLCRQIFERSSRPNVWSKEGRYVISDQTAFGTLVHFDLPKDEFTALDNSKQWCLTVAAMKFRGDGLSINIAGKLKGKGGTYCIVHQYDRLMNADVDEKIIWLPKLQQWAYV